MYTFTLAYCSRASLQYRAMLNVKSFSSKPLATAPGSLPPCPASSTITNVPSSELKRFEEPRACKAAEPITSGRLLPATKPPSPSRENVRAAPSSPSSSIENGSAAALTAMKPGYAARSSSYKSSTTTEPSASVAAIERTS